MPAKTSLPTDTPSACSGAGAEKYSAPAISNGQIVIGAHNR